MPRVQKNYHKKKYLDDGSLNPDWRPRASGKALSKFERADFIFWDGEGITRDDGKHVYALLANSTGEYRLEPDGLSTADCLEFIAEECAKYPKSIHCGFVFSYDAAMMVFADMDYRTVKRIWDDDSPYGVKWYDYRIKYRNRKSLTVQKIGDPPFILDERKGKYKANVLASGVIWDVFGFFQSSFVVALEKWLGKDYEDLQMIKDGKSHRGDFTRAQLEDEILPYCLAELKAGVKLMDLLAQYLKEAGLQVSRWDGAGAVAAALLKKYGIKDYMQELPECVERAAEHAYFGGRIEIMKYGHYEGDIYHYDINSAYPSIQRDCPSLRDGAWVHYDGGDVTDEVLSNRFVLCRVRWRLSSERIEQRRDWSIFPFPYREWAGTVIYPFEGMGWYWLPEVTAGLNALPRYLADYKDAYISIEECYAFKEFGNVRPFSFIDDLYQTRKRWKKEGRGAEKVLKLGINSLYGKTAQHTGYDPKTGRKPPYHNLAWAGFITSSTRAMLYSAAMQNPSAALFMATDGIFSTTPLDLPTGDELGLWEYEVHDALTIVQSGVYFVTTDGKVEEFSRGFDKGTLSVDVIHAAWSRKETKAYFPSTRFCAMGTATASREAWKKRGKWVGIGDDDDEVRLGLRPVGRKLNLTTQGTKRNEKKDSRGVPAWVRTGSTPDKGLVSTYAAFNNAGQMMSSKYSMPWDVEESIDGKIDGISTAVVNNEHFDTNA